MENKKLWEILTLGWLLLYVFKTDFEPLISNGTSQKRQYLASILPDSKNMNDQEIEVIYDYYTNYVLKNIKVQPGTFLYNQISAIFQKYNLAT